MNHVESRLLESLYDISSPVKDALNNHLTNLMSFENNKIDNSLNIYTVQEQLFKHLIATR